MCCVSVGRQKLHLALASGTKQKTEDFEERKNWVLFCGDFTFYPFCNLFEFLVFRYLSYQLIHPNN